MDRVTATVHARRSLWLRIALLVGLAVLAGNHLIKGAYYLAVEDPATAINDLRTRGSQARPSPSRLAR